MAGTPASAADALSGMADSLASLTEPLRRFAAERDWDRFRTPKNLAMALTGEAGELAAEYQWLTEADSRARKYTEY